MVAFSKDLKNTREEDNTECGRDKFFDALHTDQNTLMAADFKDNARKKGRGALLRQSRLEDQKLFMRQMVRSTLRTNDTSKPFTFKGKHISHHDAIGALEDHMKELTARNETIIEDIRAYKDDVRTVRKVPLLGLSVSAAYPRIVKKMRNSLAENKREIERIEEAREDIKYGRVTSLDDLPENIKICIHDRCFIAKAHSYRTRATASFKGAELKGNSCSHAFLKVTSVAASLTRRFSEALNREEHARIASVSGTKKPDYKPEMHFREHHIS